jgi:hypothetical protein
MKRNLWLLLVTTSLLGQGCLGMEKVFYDHEVVEKKDPKPAVATPTRLLRAEDVTEENAAQIAEELGAELEAQR